MYFIGTYEGLGLYADVELTDEEVQSIYLPTIALEKQHLIDIDVVPAKAVVREGRLFAFPANVEDDPRLWMR